MTNAAVASLPESDFIIAGYGVVQPLADVLTLIICLLSYRSMKKLAVENMKGS